MFRNDLVVKWFDQRDGIGIAIDIDGNEYYLSSDCCDPLLRSGDIVEGWAYTLSKTLCLKDVVKIGSTRE